MKTKDPIKYLQKQIDALSKKVDKILKEIEASKPQPETRTDAVLYREAKQVVLEAGAASSSYIQRKLKLGYARSAHIMDMLEEKGVIGPATGVQPRTVLKKK